MKDHEIKTKSEKTDTRYAATRLRRRGEGDARRGREGDEGPKMIPLQICQ